LGNHPGPRPHRRGLRRDLPDHGREHPAGQTPTEAPRLDYEFNAPVAGEFYVTASLIPTYALTGGALRFAVALDDAPAQLVALTIQDGSPEWSQGVLDNTRPVTAKLAVPSAGVHTLHVYMVDPGVV